MKTGLLIVDPQFDFCHPKGSLSVSGAHSDMIRLSEWISNNSSIINSIAVTLDSHQPNDVSLPRFWTDENGNSPKPFTQISHEEVVSGKWIPKFSPEIITVYLELLESQKEYPHIIWPEHCITGSAGASIYEPLLSSIRKWSIDNKKWYETFIKGEMPLTENFGVFRPQISMLDIGKKGKFELLFPEYADSHSNEIQKSMLQWISLHDIIYIAGEAKSHCVASTIKQAIELVPEQVSKFIILEDCMSDVAGFEGLGSSIYAKAKELGAKFEKSEKEILVD